MNNRTPFDPSNRSSFDPDSRYNRNLRIATDTVLLLIACVAALVLIGFIDSL